MVPARTQAEAQDEEVKGFLLGFVIGAVLWLLWTAPAIGVLVIALILVCYVLARHRWVMAFIIGFIIGLS